MASLAACSPLIGIEKAEERAAIWIGTLSKARRKWAWLHEVAPDGSWSDTPLGFRTRRIAHIRVSTHYLTALAKIADKQPTLSPPIQSATGQR